MAVNLYEVLNVKPTASTKEIEVAIADAEQSGIDSAMINAAKQFLLDKEKRKKYDLMLNRQPSVNKEPIAEPVKLAPPEPTVQSPPTATIDSNVKFCSACGAKLESNQAFCGGCGVKVSFYQGASKSTHTGNLLQNYWRKLSPKMAKLVIGFGVLFILLVVFFSWDAYSKAKTKEHVTSMLKQDLKDPESAKINIIKIIKGAKVTDYYNNKKEVESDIVCGKVNAKNSFGAYIGDKEFAWSSHNDRVFIYRGAKVDDSEPEEVLNDAQVVSLWLNCKQNE